LFLGLVLVGWAGRPLLAEAPAKDADLKPRVTDSDMSAYKLVWHDEFEGEKLGDQWDYRTDSKLWSAQRAENVSVKDGRLRLALKKEEAGKMHYTGGGVISKRAFKYGYYESSFKIPAGAGWHTSFWMMKHNGKGGTAPEKAAQELDVCESDSIRPTQYNINVHRWNPKPHKWMGGRVVKTPDLSAEFHVFGCEFTAERINFFFDGRLMETIDARVFEHGAQNIWLTSIAGNLGGTKAVDEGKLPGVAEFEYVRFFERE
jgi:beta-glucanase (GH16 family)